MLGDIHRFVAAASKRGCPIAIVNNGETRAERGGLQGLVYKSDAGCAPLLRGVADALIGVTHAPPTPFVHTDGDRGRDPHDEG